MDTLLVAATQYSLNIKGLLLQTGGTNLSQEYFQFVQTNRTKTEMVDFFQNHSLDTNIMLDQHSVILAAYLKFADIYESFFGLPVLTQDQIFTEVLDSLRSETFINNNPNNILINSIQSLLERINNGQTKLINKYAIPSLTVSMAGFTYKNISYNLTWNEVVGCVAETIAGAVFGAIMDGAREIYNTIKGKGFGALSIAKIARKALGGMPWGAAVGFAWCIIENTFDFNFFDLFN